MPPKCCKNCPRLSKTGSCLYDFRACERWLDWFRKAWNGIRKAAQKDKKEAPKE